MPAVSVVIPTFNREAYLPAAIASVQAQTMLDFELLVSDDGSTDGTPDLLRELAGQDRRIRVVRNTGRRGAADARNTAVAQARAEWVAFLDSDDQWEPRFLERCLPEVRPGVVMVGSDYLMVDHERNRRQTMREYLFETMIPWWERHPPARGVVDCARIRSDIHALADRSIMIGMTVGGFLWLCASAIVVRKSEIDAAGGFDPRRIRTEDLDLWVRLLLRGSVVYVDEPLAMYDFTGRDSGSGARYAGHGDRRHTAVDDARWHLRFQQALPKLISLNDRERVLLADRIAATHRRCGFALLPAHPLRAAFHYAVALIRSADQRKSLRWQGRRYFTQPW